MNFIIRLLVTALVALGLAQVLPGIHFNGFGSALAFAVVLAILNLIVRPILSVLGLPLTIITMGLFAFVINALIILLADYMLDSMNVDGFWWALIFSILLSLVTSFAESLFTRKSD